MRRFILPALLLAAAPAATAQATFGIKAGLNVATVTFDTDEDAFADGVEKQPRLGFVGGVFADVALTPSLSFHPELLYSQKGYDLAFDVEEDGVSIEGSITSQLDYIEAPLLLAYRIPVGQNGLAFGLEAGPTVAFKLRTGTACGGDFEGLCDESESEIDRIRNVDVGAALGATVGAGRFGIGARFTQGITEVDDPETDFDAVDATNRAFSFTARYSLGR